MRYLVTCQYNGRDFKGWQKQTDSRTVQGEIERILSTYFDREMTIYGSGRTDVKVHGIGQTFHFDADIGEKDKFLYAMNKMLPSDIKFSKIKTVDGDFHARFSVKQKVYRYVIELDAKDPFNADFKLLYPFSLDYKLLQIALLKFVGIHQFASFTSKPSDISGFKREIFDIKVKQVKKDIVIDFFGDGFMQGQIRMIVGTTLAVANGKIPLSYIDERLDSFERNITSYKVGGQGLYLISVKY